MLEPNDDVYEDVVKLLLEKANLQVELALTVWPPLDLPPKKRARINLNFE